MWLDLREIIEVPGASVPFSAELDPARLQTPSITGFHGPVTAEGSVSNTAGLLRLKAKVLADMACLCDRCGAAFDRRKRLEADVPLSADMEDEDEATVFPLEGDGIDISQVLETCFILETESKLLCRPDCRGVCPTCGKNLNDGPCGCEPPKDPRFAVLGQLLDIN